MTQVFIVQESIRIKKANGKYESSTWIDRVFADEAMAKEYARAQEAYEKVLEKLGVSSYTEYSCWVEPWDVYSKKKGSK